MIRPYTIDSCHLLTMISTLVLRVLKKYVFGADMPLGPLN